MRSLFMVATWAALSLGLAGCGGGGGGETAGGNVVDETTLPPAGPTLSVGKTEPTPPTQVPSPIPQEPGDTPQQNFGPVEEKQEQETDPTDQETTPPTEESPPESEPEEPVVETEPEEPPPPPEEEPLEQPVGIFDGIVYTRQPRANTPIPGTSIHDASNWQHVTDVGRINRLIGEADVVIDDLQGNQQVIHDCTTSEEICVAQEARVSPDGSKIAYSVGYGNALVEVRFGGIQMGVYDIHKLTHARLFIYDIVTRTSTPVPNHPGNAIDRQPEWLDSNTLVFASNRANLFPHKSQFSQHRGTYTSGGKRWFNAAYGVSQYYGYGDEGKSMQIWKIDIDGTNARNITPHEDMALSPMVMTNGDILYSCFNGHSNEAFDAKTRHTNAPGTRANKWWLCQMDGNGAGGHVVLNGHSSPAIRTRRFLSPDVTGGEGASELRAVRSAAEIRKNYIAITNYYRANHTGSMGIVYGMRYKGPGIEGVSRLNNYEHRAFSGDREGSGRYIPSDFLALTPYGNDQDIAVRRDGAGRVMGKAGYASALPGTDDYMITHGRGSCYEGTRAEQANLSWTGGEPLCQKGIYRVHVDQVIDPFDRAQMTLLAGGDEWQLFDSDAITNYQSLWGQPAPDRPAPLSGNRCFLQVVDARAAELQAPKPYNWNESLYEQCSSQGCGVNTENREFHADQMKYLTVYKVGLWDMTYSGGNKPTFGNTTNNHGFKSVGVWGYQELEDDGSVRMEVPCETPIQIVGQDERNMTIAHDDKIHSLRRGETRTCHGCHDGHSEERAAQIGESAVERFSRTLAAGTNHPVANNGFRRTWTDVEPILVSRCSGCHEDMNNSDGLLQSRIAWDYEQIDWPWMSRQPVVSGNFRIPRPYTSKWVGKLARNSLLYWKCMGGRQDGRTDGQYPNDIDFGSAHARVAGINECLTIGHWINQGIQWDAQ